MWMVYALERCVKSLNRTGFSVGKDLEGSFIQRWLVAGLQLSHQ